MTASGGWRLMAEKQRKGGASCVAQLKGCCAFYLGQRLNFWWQYIMAILEDVKMLEHCGRCASVPTEAITQGLK